MAGESCIDISVPLYTGLVHWPDNPPVRIERILDLEMCDAATVSKLSLGVSTGTRIDAQETGSEPASVCSTPWLDERYTTYVHEAVAPLEPLADKTAGDRGG